MNEIPHHLCYRCQRPQASEVETAVGIVHICDSCLKDLETLGETLSINGKSYTLKKVEKE